MSASRQKNINNSDKRVKKTQRLLRESLFKLLEVKSLSEISVTELTVLAEVNRSTFYFYYENIEDMMDHIQSEIYELFLKEAVLDSEDLVNADGFVSYAVKFMYFVKANHKMCSFLLKNDVNNQLRENIMSDVRAQLPDSARIFPLDDPRRYLTDYAMAAITRTIIKWMDDGMKVPPKELAQFVCDSYFKGRVAFIPIK